VGAGPRPPGLGRNWAQTEAQGGWWGPGSAAGGGAAASPRLLFKPHNIKVGELQQAFAASIEPNCRAAPIARVLGTSDRRLVHVGKAAGKRCLSGTGFSNGRIVRVSSTA
jgi:hypothetical protein